MQRRPFLKAALASTAAVLALPAFAQSYPVRTVRLVVPFAPGGPTDSFARFYAESLGKVLGQTVIVENKAGASGVIGSLDIKRSDPDGYSLLFGTASTHALYNLIEAKPQYDELADFDFVGVLGGAPVVFGSSPKMPKTLKSIVIAAKANPNKYNYGSPGTGTLLHVVAERLKQATGAPVMHIPYKGSSPARTDLMAGTIELTVDTLGGLIPYHQDNRIRIVGVATAKRLPNAPDIPTVAESADLAKPFEATLWNVIALPKGTPEAVQKRLVDATRNAMSDASLRKKLEDQFMFPDLHLGQAKAMAFIKADVDRYKPIVAALGDQIKR